MEDSWAARLRDRRAALSALLPLVAIVAAGVFAYFAHLHDLILVGRGPDDLGPGAGRSGLRGVHGGGLLARRLHRGHGLLRAPPAAGAALGRVAVGRLRGRGGAAGHLERGREGAGGPPPPEPAGARRGGQLPLRPYRALRPLPGRGLVAGRAEAAGAPPPAGPGRALRRGGAAHGAGPASTWGGTGPATSWAASWWGASLCGRSGPWRRAPCSRAGRRPAGMRRWVVGAQRPSDDRCVDT